jgi:ketosteroid isomerase-like protein
MPASDRPLHSPAGVATFRPDPDGWRALFAAIDARDARAFAAFLTEDGEFRFGNSPAVRGRTAIEAAVAGFFAAIDGCRHELLRTWVDGASAVCEGRVTYRRRDGGEVTVPFANVFELAGGAISSYRIYIDNAPLFS